MKLGEARQLYADHLGMLRSQKSQLTGVLKSIEEGITPPGRFDVVEITQRIEAIDQNYQQASQVADGLAQTESLLRDLESSRQQSDALADAYENEIKCLEIFRRISNGDRVPPSDEKRLLEYNKELYMAAKNLAFMKKNQKPKEYDSLWQDEEEPTEPLDPAEAQVDVPAPTPVPADLPAEAASPEMASPEAAL